MSDKQDLQQQNVKLSLVSMGLVLVLVFGSGFFDGVSGWIFLVAMAVGIIGCVARIARNSHVGSR
ncbi:hypothetical protein GCM10022403_038590 [Streptomyces coacervatus]|uniref:Uncharacterized protein n=1 Tax=Streptomyces coacervatus TaxID=647381 RepID=A0ABP7HS24_9ACTN|nr:hypothetical protein [Streptomyces coacervatus]MDF2270732.1 hypothetical protein [Streptomyces coacervatus]